MWTLLPFPYDPTRDQRKIPPLHSDLVSYIPDSSLHRRARPRGSGVPGSHGLLRTVGYDSDDQSTSSDDDDDSAGGMERLQLRHAALVLKRLIRHENMLIEEFESKIKDEKDEFKESDHHISDSVVKAQVRLHREGEQIMMDIEWCIRSSLERYWQIPYVLSTLIGQYANINVVPFTEWSVTLYEHVPYLPNVPPPVPVPVTKRPGAWPHPSTLTYGLSAAERLYRANNPPPEIIDWPTPPTCSHKIKCKTGYEPLPWFISGKGPWALPTISSSSSSLSPLPTVVATITTKPSLSSSSSETKRDQWWKVNTPPPSTSLSSASIPPTKSKLNASWAQWTNREAVKTEEDRYRRVLLASRGAKERPLTGRIDTTSTTNNNNVTSHGLKQKAGNKQRKKKKISDDDDDSDASTVNDLSVDEDSKGKSNINNNKIHDNMDQKTFLGTGNDRGRRSIWRILHPPPSTMKKTVIHASTPSWLAKSLTSERTDAEAKAAIRLSKKEKRSIAKKAAFAVASATALSSLTKTVTINMNNTNIHQPVPQVDGEEEKDDDNNNDDDEEANEDNIEEKDDPQDEGESEEVIVAQAKAKPSKHPSSTTSSFAPASKSGSSSSATSSSFDIMTIAISTECKPGDGVTTIPTSATTTTTLVPTEVIYVSTLVKAEIVDTPLPPSTSIAAATTPTTTKPPEVATVMTTTTSTTSGVR
jgi:hypothetical protein